MTREEAKHRLLDIERCTPIHTREDVRDFEALEMAIEALEQNESAEKWYKLFVEKLEQEPKTGHWIYFKAVNTSEIIWSECSECKDGESGCAKRMKYCPNCGAKMESED